STLTDRVASSANCEYHARIILQKYLARESIRLSTENIQNLYNDETDIEEEIESDISKKTALINNDNSDNNYQIGEVNKAGLILLDKIRCGEVESGIHIGFLGLQRKLGGWHYSYFIIIAPRPAMGKTAFAFQFIIKPAITHKIPTAIFSLEMSKEQLIIRIQSDYSYYPAERLRTGEITNDVINSISKSTEFLDKLPVYINDKAAITVSYLRAKAKKLCKKQGVKLIVIDYL